MFQIIASFVAGMYVAQEYENQVPKIKPLLIKALKDIRDTLAESAVDTKSEDINKNKKDK